MKTFKLYITVLITLTLSVSYGQHLRRKASFGISYTEVNDSISKANSLPDNKGILIKKVNPNTTASDLGLLKNDVIIKINGIDVPDKKSFFSSIENLRDGDPVSVHYIRDGKENTIEGSAVGKPKETSEYYEVIYDEVKFRDGYIRTIINKPDNIEKAPAIMFIPGYMCYSLDNIGRHPYGQLIDGLTRKGYVVMRVEKLGEGDCRDTPNCTDTDFETELAGFEKGLQSLQKYDFVDRDNIFIWGHSLGGIEAPLLAEKNKFVKGIIVNGTGLYSWYEYLLKMIRFQQPLLGQDYLEIEEMMKIYKRYQYEFLVLKKTPLELSKNKDYEKILQETEQFDGKDKIYGRNYRYWQQIEDVNQVKALKNSEAYVLSIWNSADIEAFSEEEHKTIVDIVNHYHPGKGTYLKLENTTHSLAKVDSYEHGIENHYNYKFIINNFNTKIVDETHNWIQSVIGKTD